MTEQTTDHEMIPESKAARWAYRLALMPIVGLLFSPMLCFLAMLSIGKNGYSGLELIWKTGVRLFIINVVAIAGVLYLWFLPRYIERKPSVWLTDGLIVFTTESGCEIRAFEWPVRWTKHGRWKTTISTYNPLNNKDDTDDEEHYDNYTCGKKGGKATTRFLAGEYNNDKKVGKWQWRDEKGVLGGEDIYDSDGNLISAKEYPTPSPQPTPAPATEGKSK